MPRGRSVKLSATHRRLPVESAMSGGVRSVTTGSVCAAQRAPAHNITESKTGTAERAGRRIDRTTSSLPLFRMPVMSNRHARIGGPCLRGFRPLAANPAWQRRFRPANCTFHPPRPRCIRARASRVVAEEERPTTHARQPGRPALGATRDSCLGSEPDASVKGQYHARLPCRGWRSQRGMRGARPARIARSADAAAAVKPPAFGGLDGHRHRGVGGAGVPRLSRRLSPAATCGARGSSSVPLLRPVPTRDVSRVGLLVDAREGR